MGRALVCALLFAFGLLLPRAAWAFTVPELEGHITDKTRTLDEGQKASLNSQMEAVNQASTVEIAVLVLPTLSGEAIEDVAFKTFENWKLGKAKKDNGALLVIATGERRTRIEVGKGIEGNLTDLQSNDILHQKVGPQLRQGNLFAGIQAGVTAIAAAAAGDYKVTGGDSAQQGQQVSPIVMFLVV